jgi:hypothetical protein
VAEPIATYADFWPVYLRAHRRPATRALHYLGTSLGVALVILAAALAAPWLVLAVVVVGYGCAWTGHFAIEGNKPATFGHPLWSLVSDFRMLGLWLARRLDPELEKAGIEKG